MKIDIPYFNVNNEREEVILGARIVDVAPHLIATFAVHRCPTTPLLWVVSNVETGFCISQARAGTRAASIRIARVFLAKHNQQELDCQMRKVKRGGFKTRITPLRASA